MATTRKLLPAAPALVFTVAVAALVVYTVALSPSSTRPVPQSAGADPQRRNVSEWLWPGAFQRTDDDETLTAVRFASRGKRTFAEVRSDGFALADANASADVVRVTFAGAQASGIANVTDAVPGPIRVFSSHAGTTSGTVIRRYRKVTYPEIYPGIDAVYRVEALDGDLEFDFAIRPGADPAVIQLIAAAGTRFEREPGTNNVVASNQYARYRLRKPVAYQRIRGARIDVPVRFVLSADKLTFEVGAYDRTELLTIDPLIAKYSTFVGAVTDAFYDSVNAIATDSADNVYLAGLTQFDFQLPVETGFHTTPGSLHIPNPRALDNGCQFQCGYVLKLDSNHQVVYGALIFGLDMQALAVDANGSAYATGHTFHSAEFPRTPGAFAHDPVGQTFAIKLNPAGSALEYAAFFVGEIGRAIAVDASGNAYVAGEVESAGLPTTPGALKPAYQPTGDRINADGFLLKINPTGTALIYGTYLGGTGTDIAYGVTVDAAGRAVVVGHSSSTDFVGSPGPNAGLSDAFVMQISADGSAIVNGKYLGGSGSEHAAAVSSDGQGGYLVSGATESSNFPVTPGVVQGRLLGERNGWLARLDSNLAVRYTTYFGGSFIDGLLAVTSDTEGNAYAVGPTFSGDMLTTPDGLQDASTAYTAAFLAGAGTAFYPFAHDATREAFFAVLNADGTRLEYGTYLGGYYTIDRGWEPLSFGSSIARAPNGSIYVGGSTSTESFPTIAGGLLDGMAGQADGFLVQFTSQLLAVSSPTLLPPAPIGAAYNYQLQATGGSPPYQWDVVGFALPDGVSLSPTGRISGIPANPQTENWGYQFTARVTDAAGRTAHKSLFVNPVWPGNPTCIPSHCTLSVASQQSFSFPLPLPSRAVAPLTLFVSGTLPPGISIDGPNGTIGGSPTTAGVYNFALLVEDVEGAQDTFGWQVRVDSPNPAPPPPPAPPSPSPPSNGGSGGGGALSPELLAFLMLVAMFTVMRTPRPTRIAREH